MQFTNYIKRVNISWITSKLSFQSPIFDFSSSPLLKKWIDAILICSWFFGKNGGDKLQGRKIALAVSAGIQEKDYQLDGKYHYTLEQV